MNKANKWFYQVNPANGIYVIGGPVMDEARIKVGVTRTFHILVVNNNAKNKYIQT